MKYSTSLVSLLSLATLSIALPTKRADINPYPNKDRLVYAADGTFKITVFSDLHTGENPDSFGPEQDVKTVALMNTVLKDEKPNYVVLNGDLITGENTLKENSTKNIDTLVGPLNDLQLPFSSTHGNHDNDVNIDHGAEIDRELEVAKNSYTRKAPNGVGGSHGPGNYWVPVYAKKDDKAPALVMWFFDSQAGKDTSGKNIDAVVDSSVADWIKSESKTQDDAWGAADKRATIAFVHIPPSAIKNLQQNLPSSATGLNADALGDGSVQTSEDGPFYDAVTGLTNLKAIISGHDHGNEWCAREPTKDVIFCFDKHSGYGGYDKGWGRGVRNLVFKSADPKTAVDTHIRLEAGEKRAEVTLDTNFKR